MTLPADRGGSGERLIVLLHGLGATRHVWERMLDLAPARWNGRWIAPDLRGHGASARALSYGLGLHASDVAELVLTSGAYRELVIVGHSMGGVIALALASGWFGVTPARCFGLGIKVAWSADELAKLDELASAMPRAFATKDEAVARYLKSAGLTGLIEPGSRAAKAGVSTDDAGWHLAADPATASVGAPPMQALIAAAKAPVHLARGEGDRMVSLDQLRVFDPEAIDLPGAHNAMIERPDAVWHWIESKRA
jgi:pimeloyl-ACP methyl ester carboxylesterase